MRTFSEVEKKKYIKFTDENVIEVDEVMGQCFICGELLSEVENPQGPEKIVVCLKDRNFFVEHFEELVELGEIK